MKSSISEMVDFLDKKRIKPPKAPKNLTITPPNHAKQDIHLLSQRGKPKKQRIKNHFILYQYFCKQELFYDSFSNYLNQYHFFDIHKPNPECPLYFT